MQEEERRHMSDADIERLAELIAEKMTANEGECLLSEKEVFAVRDLIQTKKHAVKAFLVLIGALCLWIVKDTYGWIVGHMTFK